MFYTHTYEYIYIFVQWCNMFVWIQCANFWDAHETWLQYPDDVSDDKDDISIVKEVLKIKYIKLIRL